jgi:hypothetical protein
MAKVRANLQDVSTEFVPAMPNDYELKIVDVEDKTQGEKEQYNVVLQIDEQGNEEYGKKMYDNISLYKNDGGRNTAGEAQLKRYFEAVFGKDEVADPDFEFDTDLLKNQRIMGSVVIEDYTKKDGSKGQSNRAKKIWKL